MKSAITPGATVITGAWSGYTDGELVEYDHLVLNLSSCPDPAYVLLPGPHRVISLVKRWLLGTFQGAVAAAQLPYYLDEFTSRFNRRGSRSRGLLFYRLLEQACQVPHTPTASLSQGIGRGPKRIAGSTMTIHLPLHAYPLEVSE